ncbi:MAG: PQQ-binding-like beta-propeller repeat protein [Rhodobacteraceae bacterium]|nr:PQQ-binding-like beta-propeller repeat protein [Paracoccaceae bacterium]
MGAIAVKLSKYAAGIIVLGLFTACSAPEVILTGERFGLRDEVPDGPADGANAVSTANRSVPISLPAPTNHAAWTHRAGEPDHAIRQPIFSISPTLIWTAKTGQGNDRKHRITADPVVADGRIFTLDSRAKVTAFSTQGSTLWSADLTPDNERSDDASGGGLAVAGGRLFVSSGFGTVSALEVNSGAVIWTQKIDAPVSGAPTVVDGVVYIASKDSRAFAIDATNGRIKWQLAGTPDVSSVVGTSSPALAGGLILFPFPSGELVAVKRQDGARAWGALVTGQRRGRGYSSITDITGEPVVANGVVYAGNPVGRTIAMNLEGSRIWTASDGATGPVWVDGGSVFLISDEAKLVRLDASTGSRIWAIDLPYFTKEKARRRKAIYANFGPVMASGNLWVASSDGVMRAFNPVDGSMVASVDIPGGAASRPVIVNGVAYLVNTKGQLLALH